MDSDYWRKVERVLDVALESEPSSWPALVAEHCENDEDLRREVESLLSRYSTASSYLRSRPAAAAAALLAEARVESDGISYEGRRFGAYKVVRELGRGGMSRVFLAERADGEFEQQVALKLLRPGLDSEIDLSRFKVERQILASLNHPNIARLLDGGVTPEGVPFLLMEFVDGEPVDRYCEARSFDTKRRLELFLDMASAVQSAHRSLIVHRDLKPSNILVTREGTVKLLDFGLAKLLEPGAPAAGSAVTMSDHRWMTPEYAAPEQILGRPITTSTDVYQLGAVLYRLLVGRPPFGDRGSSVHELETAILEREMPPMVGPLRGDLDAILRKALAKEPSARYASVQDFAEDVRRYLSRQPVQARRQTIGYRVRRFARRRRGAVVAVAALVALLAVYLGTVFVDRARIRRALVEAQAGTHKAEQVTDFMLGLFQAAEGGQSLHDTVTAHLLLSRGVERARALNGQPELKAQMLDVIGRIHTQLGESDKAKPLLTEALAIRRSLHGDLHPDIATSLDALADVSIAERDNAETIRLRRQVLDIRRALAGIEDPKTLNALYALALSVHRAGQTKSAEPLFNEWLTAISRQPRDVSELRASQLNQAGEIVLSRGQFDRADSLLREALAIRRSLYGDNHSLVAGMIQMVATVASRKGDHHAADSLYRRAEQILRSAYPDGHPSMATTLELHGYALHRANRYADSDTLFRESRVLVERFEGPNSIHLANSDINLGLTLTMLGKYREAETYDRDAIRIFRSSFDDKNAMVVMARDHLGDALRGEGRFAEAESLLLAGYERFKVPNSVTKGWRGHALNALIRLYDAEGRPEESAKYRALLNAPPAVSLPSSAKSPNAGEKPRP